MGKPSRDGFKPAWDASQGACHDGTQPSRTPREVLLFLLLRTPPLKLGGFSLPWGPRRPLYSSSWHSWSKVLPRPAGRGAVSPIKSDLLSAPLRNSSPVGGRSAVLGPVDGRNDRPAVSPWSVSLIVISFGDTVAGAAKILLLLQWSRPPAPP